MNDYDWLRNNPPVTNTYERFWREPTRFGSPRPLFPAVLSFECGHLQLSSVVCLSWLLMCVLCTTHHRESWPRIRHPPACPRSFAWASTFETGHVHVVSHGPRRLKLVLSVGPLSMVAFWKVSPWDLCIVSAHANRNGIWEEPPLSIVGIGIIDGWRSPNGNPN